MSNVSELSNIYAEVEVENCPRCGFSHLLRLNSVLTGEEYALCYDCGYHEDFSYLRDKNGKFLLKDDTLPDDWGNMFFEAHQEKTPYGVYMVKLTNGAFDVATLKTRDSYVEFRRACEIMTTNSNLIEQITVTKLAFKKIMQQTLYEKGVPFLSVIPTWETLKGDDYDKV